MKTIRVEFKRWLEQVGYRLMSEHYNSSGLHYALFMQHIYVEGHSDFPYPAGIGCTKEGKILLIFNDKFVEQLPLEVGVELFKHEVLHLIHGHIASWRREALMLYGDTVCLLAMDISVNQFIDCALMEKAGMSPVTCEKFDLPKDKTTEWYCSELAKRIRDDKLTPEQKKYTTNYSLGDEKKGGDSDQERIEIQVGSGPWEKILDDESVPADVIEGNLVNIISCTNQEVQSQRGDIKATGWNSADVKELIESVKRKPIMPWHAILRRMESRHRAENKIPSLFKASRRGATPPYMGRVRKFELNIWFAVDTSGSMSSTELSLVDAELKGIVQRGANILVIHCDASIVKMEKYHPRKGLNQFHGRGGTDFSPTLIELCKLPLRLKPSFLVYYTDGFGNTTNYLEFLKSKGFENAWNIAKGTTKTPCGVEVLWLLPKRSTRLDRFKRIAPFGRYEEIPDVS